MNKNSKIFVAGHNGLVGSAVYQELIAQGYNNIIVKNRSELDLENKSDVEQFFNDYTPELVFLCAAKVGGINANNLHKADFLTKNLSIQNNVIIQAYESGVKRLLFLGSSCIYPNNITRPIKETDLLTGPLERTNEFYALAKIAGLKLCEALSEKDDVHYFSVMPTNLYGPNDTYDLKYSHVLPAVIIKILIGKLLMENQLETIKNWLGKSTSELTRFLHDNGISKDKIFFWGTGEPLREFLHSEDLAKACVHLVQNNESLKERRITHVNIGSGEELSIKKLISLVTSIAQYKGEILFDSTMPNGTMRKRLDNSLIKSLGWAPSIKLKNGITAVIKQKIVEFHLPITIAEL